MGENHEENYFLIFFMYAEKSSVHMVDLFILWCECSFPIYLDTIVWCSVGVKMQLLSTAAELKTLVAHSSVTNFM